ncbi:hypothetical protein [Numidum massiliense]|nr:hypothetical protein [Numidum massiliense]
MKDQLHIRNGDDYLDFSKIVHHYEEPDVSGDRNGGFWTSTYNRW